MRSSRVVVCHFVILSVCFSVYLPFSFVFCLFKAKLLKRGNYRLKERGGGGLRSSRVVAKIRFRTFLLRRRTSAPVRCGRQVSQNIIFFSKSGLDSLCIFNGLSRYLFDNVLYILCLLLVIIGHRLGGEETLALYKNNMAKMQIFPSFGFEKNILRLVFEKKQKRFR